MKRLIVFLFCLLIPLGVSASLSCSVMPAASCTSPSVVVLRMSSSTDAHTELPSGTTAAYSANAVCCTGGSSLGTSCSGTFASIGHLSSTTNAHFEENTSATFSQNACLSVGAGSVTVGYQNTNCSGYDISLFSISSTTNAHVGIPTAYTAQVCASVGPPPETLSFSISANTIDFGSLSPTQARYATASGGGTSTETEAHTIAASTNASAGYTISVNGPTLTSGASTIVPIGETNTTLAPGTSQFGLRMSASGGTGAVSSPYAASGFAYAGASGQSAVASEASGDGAVTTYSVRYAADISSVTSAGSYSTSLTYIITPNF